MFWTLIALTFVVAIAVSTLAWLIFRKPVGKVLEKIVGSDTAEPWTRYFSFALFFFGISGGVPVNRIELYLDRPTSTPLNLDAPHIGLEVYRTVIDSGWAITVLLFAFLVISLFALAIVRAVELRKQKAG